VLKDASPDEPTAALFRAAKDLNGPKEAMYSFCREIREIRQKSLHAALERSAVSGKDLELIKTYGLPLERMKDFGGFASRIGSIALDKLRSTPLHGKIPGYKYRILWNGSNSYLICVISAKSFKT
jgi:hypothetical protein